jgi:hypothetical protein
MKLKTAVLTAVQPPSPMCLAKLFKIALDGTDLGPMRERLIAHSQSKSADAAALMGLCTIEQLLGDQASGLNFQTQALNLQRLYSSPWPASPHALRVLAFKAAGDLATNTPLEFLLERSDVVLYSLYIAPGEPLPDLPDHDIAIVAVGESDRDRPVMQEIEKLIQTWPCPVLNRPDRVLQLSRDGMNSLLRGVPGLVLPPTARIDRADFEKLGRGLLPLSQYLQDTNFPLIARPVGSHAGEGLMRLDGAGEIASYLSDQPDVAFFISPYIDYRSADGQFRKYRIAWIDGRPYPGHMAIADQWKVWYYNAGMADSPAKRAEEERFMSDFDNGFARRHVCVLAAMAARFALEYVVVDCAELPDGRLLLFEGGTCPVVHDMDPPDLYPYKSPPTQKLFAAFYDMLKRKSK